MVQYSFHVQEIHAVSSFQNTRYGREYIMKMYSSASVAPFRRVVGTGSNSDLANRQCLDEQSIENIHCTVNMFTIA